MILTERGFLRMKVDRIFFLKSKTRRGKSHSVAFQNRVGSKNTAISVL